MPVTEFEIYNEIQYSMLEPPDDGVTWPSDLWTGVEVQRYMNQRQNRFIFETHPNVLALDIPVTAFNGIYTLPQNFVAAYRVVWTPAGRGSLDLVNSDQWEADHGIPDWTNVEGPPKIYYIKPNLTVQLAPTPDEDGDIRFYYIGLGTTFDGTDIDFSVQDEMVHIIKYGVMGDMLSKVARANDPRSQYCFERFQTGVDIVNLLLRGTRHAKVTQQ